MKQVIRDGKVGVLVSGGFGAGFSTWNELPKEAVFHPTLIEMVENKRHSEITKELVKEFDTNTEITTTLGLTNNSKFFKVPDETFIIIYECLKCNINNCGETELNVVPKTHDEFNAQYKNPFKRPNKNKVWRLDISKINNDKVVELITPYTVSNYKLRYIKYPKPIIISDLSTTFPGEGLTINGLTGIQQCELDPEIHPEILDRAVQLALRDYKPSNLESKILVDLKIIDFHIIKAYLLN